MKDKSIFDDSIDLANFVELVLMLKIERISDAVKLYHFFIECDNAKIENITEAIKMVKSTVKNDNKIISEYVVHELKIIIDKLPINKGAFFRLADILHITNKDDTFKLIGFFVNHSADEIERIANLANKVKH